MTVVTSNFERKHLDLYETEAWATEALLRHFSVDGLFVWEPAAGNDAIAKVLEANKALGVFKSDIENYDTPKNVLYDFLGTDTSWRWAAIKEPEAIITNPPYGKGNRDAVRWAELSLKRCSGLVALLLTAKFDFGKTRTHLFRDNKRFAAKIALMDRIQWFPGATSGTEDHAWYVWRGVNEAPSTPVLLYEGRKP